MLMDAVVWLLVSGVGWIVLKHCLRLLHNDIFLYKSRWQAFPLHCHNFFQNEPWSSACSTPPSVCFKSKWSLILEPGWDREGVWEVMMVGGEREARQCVHVLIFVYPPSCPSWKCHWSCLWYQSSLKMFTICIGTDHVCNVYRQVKCLRYVSALNMSVICIVAGNVYNMSRRCSRIIFSGLDLWRDSSAVVLISCFKCLHGVKACLEHSQTDFSPVRHLHA